MNNDDNLQALEALYTFYDEFMSDYSLACSQGCSLSNPRYAHKAFNNAV